MVFIKNLPRCRRPFKFSKQGRTLLIISHHFKKVYKVAIDIVIDSSIESAVNSNGAGTSKDVDKTCLTRSMQPLGNLTSQLILAADIRYEVLFPTH